uniref:Uncharacterized protein n=1 Tax=Rhizophagus irregularis (strain DAOM 181602 / DAOM 197198 / MUCL 43194) TaxID=747089 RepID=U9UFZ8_RHIID
MVKQSVKQSEKWSAKMVGRSKIYNRYDTAPFYVLLNISTTSNRIEMHNSSFKLLHQDESNEL